MTELAAPNVSYGDRELALSNEILRTVVGSGVHGIAIDGTDDLDLMAVYIEPRSWIYGIHEGNADQAGAPGMDHHISRTKPEGERSGPGDIDLACYSLRKFLRLAIKGHPTVLLPLFAPESDIVHNTKLGAELREMRTLFLSQESVERFLGYMREQHERMMGGGKRNRVPNRPELIEKYGWDVKFGSHALRLALQGWEVATTGHLSLPMKSDDREQVLSVKRGEVPRAEVSDWIYAIERDIRQYLEGGYCQLPPHPSLPQINLWSIEAHEQHWFHGRRQ